MKNIIYVAGVVSIVTSLIFVLLGKLDIVTFGGLNTTVLGLLYGWYERIERQQVEADHTLTLMQLQDKDFELKKLLAEAKFLQKAANGLHEENIKLTEKIKASTEILPKLKKLVEDSVEVTTKKPRTRKVKK